MTVAAPIPAPDRTARPLAPLSRLALFQISVFWFVLNSTWGGFELFQQERVVALVGPDLQGLALGALDFLVLPVAILTMPIAGSVSDHWVSRWGRRRPFVLVGALSGAAAFTAMAFAPNFVTLLLCLLAMQLTLNLAKGPFAGLVPDLVPDAQVSTASALMGLMITLGLVGGNLIMTAGYLVGFTVPVVALSLLIAVTGTITFLVLPAGPAALPREGRSWRSIALSTFGTDILRERDYVHLLVSRFFVMLAGGFFLNLAVLYLQNVFGLGEDVRGTWWLAGAGAAMVGFLLGTVPAARISDRVGRKPVIYAATAIGAVAMTVVALAPRVELAIAALVLLGVANGAFLAVDWALMTELIPRASAGRYMGLSNVTESANGALASAIGGPTITLVGAWLGFGLEVGTRVTMLLAVASFGLGAWFLRGVREPGRGRPGGGGGLPRG